MCSCDNAKDTKDFDPLLILRVDNGDVSCIIGPLGDTVGGGGRGEGVEEVGGVEEGWEEEEDGRTREGRDGIVGMVL